MMAATFRVVLLGKFRYHKTVAEIAETYSFSELRASTISLIFGGEVVGEVDAVKIADCLEFSH